MGGGGGEPVTHVRDEVQKGVAAERAHGQRNQEAKQELEEDFVHERHEHHAQKRQQADDRDGQEAAQPRCIGGSRKSISRFQNVGLSSESRVTYCDAFAALAVVIVVVIVVV